MSARADVISTPLQYALRYASLGWPVFACRENEKRPIAAGGFHGASTERADIIGAWQQHPRANPAIPAGAHWWVLDVDPRHGGGEALAALEGQHGELPNTLIAQTPSGGVHYYFAPDTRARNTTAKLGPGLDTRGHGGYVLVEGAMVAGSRYAYQDWDPLTDPAPELAAAPAWLLQLAFGTPEQRERVTATTEATVAEGGRNAFLARQAGRLRRMGYGVEEIESTLLALNLTRCRPPLDDSEVSAVAVSVSRYAAGQIEIPHDAAIPEPPAHVLEALPDEAIMAGPDRDEERADGVPKAVAPNRNIIDWMALTERKAPKFEWILEDWLSWHPTLLAGRGGIGKSLLTQQIATGLAMRSPMFRLPQRQVRVLYWACEDDHDELWRRQERICAWLGLTLEQLDDNLIIDARLGLENTLFSTEYGRPCWTPLAAELEQQVNDYRIDVLMLDNIGQIFGANENDRHHVTSFTNGVMGLVRGRPFCPVFLGHPAKATGSEYAGNAAWENAVRMRWFLSDRLPDEPVPEEGEEIDQSLRFLCKRKANYATKDYIRFRFIDGVLSPEQQAMDSSPRSVVDAMYEKRAEQAVLDGLKRIGEMGKTASDTPGPSYLPKQLMQFGLAQGCSKRELEQAMRRLMTSGSMKRAEIGKYANRTPKFGLMECR